VFSLRCALNSKIFLDALRLQSAKGQKTRQTDVLRRKGNRTKDRKTKRMHKNKLGNADTNALRKNYGPFASI
jgi:hypothetical protein